MNVEPFIEDNASASYTTICGLNVDPVYVDKCPVPQIKIWVMNPNPFIVENVPGLKRRIYGLNVSPLIVDKCLA